MPTTFQGVRDRSVMDGAADRPIAALDLGTNNCRLLVARPRGRELEIVDSFSRMVRLGEGLQHTGSLSEAAIQRTIAALRVCQRIIARNGAAQARCVATEACRRARNGSAFLDRVKLASGLTLEVLATEDEARLALLGCLPLADRRFEQLLVIDVGGGSTEFVWLARDTAKAGVVHSCSVPLGVVTLAEQFGDDPDEASFRHMVQRAKAIIDDEPAVATLDRLIDPAQLQAIGTSGTVTTLAAIELGLQRYDRQRVDGTWLDVGALDRVSAAIRKLGIAGRARHPCIGVGRADLVVAGCAIVEAIHRRWPFTALRVADRGLREGILTSLLGETLEDALQAYAADTV